MCFMEKTKKIIKNQIVNFRRLNSRKRLLPEFIIVGAQKAGTTSLHSYLSQHQKILSGLKKEIHFFDGGIEKNVDTYREGELWYRAHFPKASLAKNGEITFEGSPFYMFNPLVPERIHSLLPDIKLIFLLRDPVERAISHYYHTQKKFGDPLSILDAMLQEEARISKSLDTNCYKSDGFIHYSYKTRGLYLEQLQRFLQYFGKHQVLVLQSERMHSAPTEILGKIFEFLQLDDMSSDINIVPRNVSSNKLPVDDDVYAYLTEYFRSPNLELFEFLGVKYDWKVS